MQTPKHKPIEPTVPEQQTPSSSNMLFMHEDDITYWLHYPIEDTSLQTYLYNNSNNNINDLLYPSPPFNAPVTVPPTYLPPSPPSPPSVMLPSCSSTVTPEVQASNVTVVGVGAVSTGKEVERCEMSVSVTSSPGSSGSGESGGVETAAEKPTSLSGDRKRKSGDKDGGDVEIYNKDAELGYQDVNKQSHGGSTSTKRPRSVEVHNLSERRRRDRINEKMKALQKLIPRCNKSDKASMLDEAIEYLKSLQTQVHMMSMGCSIVPAMFLGAQQYISPNPPMGMGMGMGMGMNRAMFPYPVIPSVPSVPNPAVVAATSAAILGQCFSAPGFNITPVPVAGPTANLSAPMMSSLTLNSQNLPQVLGFADPFQQYHGLHQTKLPIPQKQRGTPSIATKESSSKDNNTPDHHHHQTS